MNLDDQLIQRHIENYSNATTDMERQRAYATLQELLVDQRFKVGEIIPLGLTYGDLPPGIQYVREGDDHSEPWTWDGTQEGLVNQSSLTVPRDVEIAARLVIVSL